MDSLIQFAAVHCRYAYRNNWNSVLRPMDPGSLERTLWALAFLKSTNGVADAVSCGHFRTLIALSKANKAVQISLDLCDSPLVIASLIRQTSKWVKNTFVLVNIFRHIRDKWNGVPSKNFTDWLQFYEVGPKTAALFFHAAFDIPATLPVDSHVWHAFKKWNWTNAKTPDECSWQASRWMPPDYFIKTNDAIGSIRQSLARNVSKRTLLFQAKRQSPELKELIFALAET
jgi:endonuclease III